MSERAAKKRTEILLIGHYSLFQESVSCLLSTEPDFKISVQCTSVAQALDAMQQQPIDVVLLDFDLEEGEARDFVHAARQRGFKGNFLLLAAEVNPNDAAELIQAGVCGIFHKRDSAALLRHAIRDVAAGNLWFRREQLQSAFNRNPASTANNGLTRREKQVLSLVSEGFKNREIGTQIGVSEGSVKATLQQLFSKFGVRSRSQLVRLALINKAQNQS